MVERSLSMREVPGSIPSASICPDVHNGGLVVEYHPATVETRVRFPDVCIRLLNAYASLHAFDSTSMPFFYFHAPLNMELKAQHVVERRVLLHQRWQLIWRPTSF